ncbi:MAG TPA: hypothetical protein PKX87_01220 [Alphaproteobacteria bacterium]|nr:hypothetical protein [Alphaproteobacteria bacterium]
MTLRIVLLFVFVLSFGSAASVQAQEGAGPGATQTETPFAAPCDFTVAFPEKPYVTRRCKGASGGECYDILTYTRVFELSNAVTVKATCNPVAPDMAGRLTEAVMRTTLESMVARKSVGQYDLKFSERDGVRSATLFGEGVKGMTPTLYVAQLWLGASSLLTVEAELTGDANPQADSLFGDVLKSIRAKDAPASARGEEKTGHKVEPSAEEKADDVQIPAKKGVK